MPYTTAQDVREALSPEGSDTTAATAASLSDAALEDAITEATAEVDAKVKGAPYPDGSVPAIIGPLTRDVAAYLATLTHRAGLELPADNPVALRYARAQGILAAAAAGKLDLSFPPTQEAAAGEVAAVNPYEGDLFTLETLGLGIDRRFLPPWVASGEPATWEGP